MESTDRPGDRSNGPGPRHGKDVSPSMQTKPIPEIKAARRRRGLTQKQLAERVGTTRVTIARIETGARKPSMDLALAIARELRTSAEKLWGGR